MLERHELSAAKTWKNLKVKEANLNKLYTHHMVPVIWHSEKGKSAKTVKRPLFTRAVKEGREGWIDKHRGFLWKWKHPVWKWNDRHVIIHLRKPMECTAPRVQCGFFTVTNIHTAFTRDVNWGENACAGARSMRNLCTFLSILMWT